MLRRLSLIFYNTTQKELNSKLAHFTNTHTQKTLKEISGGRAWLAKQLRQKSDQQLHKIWISCLKQKNLLISDITIKKALQGDIEEYPFLKKVKLTMKRIKTVLSQRQTIRKEYWKQLENQYVEKKKKEIEQKIALQTRLPKITWQLIRAKLKALKSGVDNVQYIEEAVKKEKEKEDYNAFMNQKYKKENRKQFKSILEVQLAENRPKISQLQLLRAHVKNWHFLNKKQQRQIANILSSRRARQAKKLLSQQLKILKLKIQNFQNKMGIQNKISEQIK